MSALLLPLIVGATVLVILSGIWVTIALIAAIRRVDRPSSGSSGEPTDKSAS